MLAMGWNIERTKEGEAMFQQRESEKQKKISESLVNTLVYDPLRVPILLISRLNNSIIYSPIKRTNELCLKDSAIKLIACISYQHNYEVVAH